jgi:hypothetical protein
MWDAPKAKFGLMFLVHQVIVLWVVMVSAGILAASALNFLKLFGWRHPKLVYAWLLSGNNFYPCQVALALLLGWILGRALQDRSMVWVWLLPSLGMAYALLNVPTLVPRLVKPEFQAGIGQSRLFHYFGSGCQLGNYCIDQSSITRPFYASLAYSLAAWVALGTFKRWRQNRTFEFLVPLLVGILFLIATIYDFIQSLYIGGWRWEYLYFVGTPIAMWLYLILLAYDIHKNSAVKTSDDVAAV